MREMGAMAEPSKSHKGADEVPRWKREGRHDPLDEPTREEKLTALQAQVQEGTLVIKSMSDEELEAHRRQQAARAAEGRKGRRGQRQPRLPASPESPAHSEPLSASEAVALGLASARRL